MIVCHSSYPEGPVCTKTGLLYFVEYDKDRIMCLQSGDDCANVFLTLPKASGPSGLAHQNGVMFVALYDAHKVIVLDMSTKETIAEIKIPYPNDIALDIEKSKMFVTSSGPFVLPSEACGAVYMTSTTDYGRLTKIISGLYFSNGIVVYGDKLYVAEHFKNRVQVYSISENEIGWITNVDLPRTLLDNEYIGPDGLCQIGDFIYIAHFTTGNILKYSINERCITETIKVSDIYVNVTNICSAGGENIYVTTFESGCDGVNLGVVKLIYIK